MAVTSFLAIWGAILSTVAVTWNIIRDRNDKGKIRLTGYIGKVIPGNPEERKLVVTITNIGRRPIRITGWGATKKKQAIDKRCLFILGRHLPVTLKEGDEVVEINDDLTLLSEDIKTLYAIDSTSKMWKMKEKYFKGIVLEMQKT